MNLRKRKELAAKVLGVGKGRIIFDETRLGDIKEAITKQDIRDMYAEGIISLRDTKGRMQKPKRKTRVGPGKIKMTKKNRKLKYIILVRKFRRYIGELKSQEKISQETFDKARTLIRAKAFKDKSHLKEYLKIK